MLGLVACGNGDILDNTSPEVSDTVPEDGDDNVAINRAIVVRFNEDIDEATLTTTSFTLTDADDNAVTGTVAVDSSNQIAVFTPSDNLAISTTYTATVTTDVEDSDENNLEGDTGWTFTTGIAADSAAPTLTTVDPEDDDTNVDRDRDVIVTFSEAMNPLTLTTSSFTIIDADDNLVDGDLSFDVATETLTFNPDENFQRNTEYTVTVTTDSEDLAGNALISDSVWVFTTEN